MKLSGNDVHAIVVTFNPDWAVLSTQLLLLNDQVTNIWVIDNASTEPLQSRLASVGLGEKLQCIQLSDNFGLGVAQNVGIEHARDAGAAHLLILDQDSLPMPNMVQCLLQASDQLHGAAEHVAAIAPTYADSAAGPASGFVRLGWFDYKKLILSPEQTVVEIDFAISSGSLIRVMALDDIGLMDESLFIDHVDTEWCLRARSKGYKLFGVPAARMVHTLGDKRTRFWCFRWRQVPHHSPFRYYYILRNSLLIQRRNYVPIKWRIAEAIRSVRVLVYFSLFGSQRRECLRMMSRGLWHGLKGVIGPMPKP